MQGLKVFNLRTRLVFLLLNSILVTFFFSSVKKVTDEIRMLIYHQIDHATTIAGGASAYYVSFAKKKWHDKYESSVT